MRKISYSRISILFIFRAGRSWGYSTRKFEISVLAHISYVKWIFVIKFHLRVRNIFFQVYIKWTFTLETPSWNVEKTYFSYLFRSPCPFQGCHSIQNALGPSILQQFSPIFHPSTNPPFLYPPIISIRMSNRNKQEVLLIVGSDYLQTNSDLKIKLMKIIKLFLSPYKSIET